MACPACSRENASMARHQAAICRGQGEEAAAEVLETFAGQLERIAAREADPRVVKSILCPWCKRDLLLR